MLIINFQKTEDEPIDNGGELHEKILQLRERGLMEVWQLIQQPKKGL